MKSHFMTRKRSSTIAIIGLVFGGPFLIDIAISIYLDSMPALFKVNTQKYLGIFLILCFISLNQYIYGFLMHIGYKYINYIPITSERDFRILFENPASSFLVWRETLEILRERRGW